MYATTLCTKLEQEWADRHAHRLFDFDRIGEYTGVDLLKLIGAASEDEKDRILYRLLQLAHDGDRAAERVLVQVLIPSAKRHAHRVRVVDGFTLADRVGIAIGTAWEVVRNYPMRHSTRVFLNLSMQLLRALHPEPTVNEVCIARRTFAVTAESLEYLLGGWSPNPEPEVQLLRVFTWALDHDIVTRDEVALMTRAYLGGQSMEVLATEVGIKPPALYKRVARTRTRIADAWATASMIAA